MDTRKIIDKLKQKFIDKANILYDFKYDYSLVEYINYTTKVKIICPIHGMFEQLINSHLRGHECNKCGIEMYSKSNTRTHDDFINKLKLIQPNLTILGEYVNGYTKILVKDEFDIEYLVIPNGLLKGSIPSITSSVNKNSAFSIKANMIHNYKYNYDKVEYIGTQSKIIINCPEHGDFIQSVNSHLSGKGCSSCNIKHGYSKSSWILHCNNKKNSDPRVYIIRCYNNNEEFIKIGITTRLITKRFDCKNSMPYSYEVIKEFKGSSDFVWDKEHELHKLYNSFKYKPLIPFLGDTECFTKEILPLIK